MVVIERLNTVLYKVKSGPRAKPGIVHHDHMYPYLCDDKPTWFVDGE